MLDTNVSHSQQKTEKLPLLLAAPGAIARHPNLSASDFKALLAADILFHLWTQQTLKLDDFATTQAYQVMMLNGCFYLIVVVGLIKMKLFY
jgi:hypothetical protein